MSIKEWLAEASKILRTSGISTARLDCLVLLEDVLGTDRTQLLAHDDQALTRGQLKNLNDWITRRVKHEPLSYIRGKTEFYGREFAISPDTLEPRPETETMLTLVKKLLNDKEIVLVDVGTGSGAIAITAKLEHRDLHVLATEINEAALKVAEKNARSHRVQIDFYLGNLLEPLPAMHLFGVVANLPYVPDNFTINEAAMQEPKVAIFGGPDGLDVYRKMFEQIDALPSKPLFILTEALPFQHHALATLARGHSYTLEKTDDFIQVFKR